MFERSEVLDYLDVIALKERVKPLNIINHAKGEVKKVLRFRIVGRLIGSCSFTT